MAPTSVPKRKRKSLGLQVGQIGKTESTAAKKTAGKRKAFKAGPAQHWPEMHLGENDFSYLNFSRSAKYT
jgi:hypothetical protein